MSEPITSLEDRASYAVGRQLGENLAREPFEGMQPEAVLAGIADALTGKSSPISAEKLNEDPTTQEERVTEICNHVAASHFVVEKRMVYFRKAGTKDDINMPHYNTALPDGYYFCSDPLLPKSHLE